MASYAKIEHSSLDFLSRSLHKSVFGRDRRSSIASSFQFKHQSRNCLSLRVFAGIQIDRRRHFDELLKRQLEAEAREAEVNISCPLDCVREVHNYQEFEKVLHHAEEDNELVVVDFYNSSCGACKYLLPQLIKLCKRGCSDECSVNASMGVVFVKHNVRDEYDELTDLARFYSIRTVPMFAFFVNGSRVEQFPTRDRQRLRQALCRILGQLLE